MSRPPNPASVGPMNATQKDAARVAQLIENLLRVRGHVVTAKGRGGAFRHSLELSTTQENGVVRVRYPRVRTPEDGIGRGWHYRAAVRIASSMGVT